jgi:DHA1 family bicyclomycin/chloramphenicol resistance-like MFS transporter
MNKTSSAVFIFISLLILGFLNGAEVDLFVPSFPELRRLFALTTSQVEALLSINLMAHCVAALGAGHLGDHYGRKRIILAGLWVFILGSGLSVFASSYPMLLVGRLLQGIGIAGPATLSYLIIADSFSIKRQQQLMGQLNGVITLSMGCAPLLGTYLTIHWGWRSNFVFLLAWALLCVGVSWIFLPNTASREAISQAPHDVSSADVSPSYWAILSDPKVRFAVLGICWIVVPYWVFVGISSMLWVEDLGVPLKHYGFYQGALLIAFSMVSLTSGYWLKRWGAGQCYRRSLQALVVFTLLLVIASWSDVRHPMLILMLMLIECVAMVFPINVLYPRVLAMIEGGSGKISALINSGRLILSALGMQVVGHFYQHNFASVGWVMAAAMTLGLVCLWRLSQNYRLEDAK